jgi:hypothetical protein
MTDAQELLSVVIRAGEGTIKAGFENVTNAGVTYSISGDADTITFSGVIPITPSVNAAGAMTINARDFITSATATV